MRPSTLKKLSAICIVSATVPAASALAVAEDAARAIGLLRRADAAVCGGDSSLSQCGSNFPSSFCCPSSTTCTALNDDRGSGGEATSVICCPEGQDCKFIRPITCDINQQNASLHPSNAIHTTNLTATLETCGSECCPLGYKCQSGLCAMISANDTSGSSTTSAAPSTTSISTPTGGSVTSGLGPSDTSTTATPLSAKHERGANKGAIAGGVIGGIALGILLTVLGVWLWKRRQTSEKKPRYSGDFGPVSRTVSDPIYNPALGARTEFLRRDAASPPGNASIDHTLLGSPFSPMKEINKVDGLGRNGTMTTTTTSHSSGSATPLNPYGYARPNIPKRSPSKPYGSLKSGPGGGMAAASPKSPRIRGLFSRPSKSNLSEYPMPPPPPMTSGSVSPSVYTPTPAPRGPQRQRSSSTARQPMGPTRNFSLGPRRSQSLSGHGDMSRERPRTGSTETIDVLMTGSNQPSGMGFLAPPPGIRVPGERPLTSDTTFTRLMENAGYGRETRDHVNGWGNMGVAGHAADSPRNRI